MLSFLVMRLHLNVVTVILCYVLMLLTRYGLVLEREWGIPKTMVIYFVSGIAGKFERGFVYNDGLLI